MRITAALSIGAGVLTGAPVAADAQPQVQRQAVPDDRASPYNQAPPARFFYRNPSIPPSWYYNPYTDGTVPTPRGGTG